jgi:hypothetical protein
LPVVEPGGVRFAAVVAARVIPAGELWLGHGGGQGQAAAAWLQIGHEGGRRLLRLAGRMVFWDKGKMEKELVRWISTVEIDEGAINAFVKGKLSPSEHRVWNAEWEGLKGKQSTNGNVSKFPVCQVEDLYNTVWPPVGNTVVPNLSPKLGQGRWGCPFRGHALCWWEVRLRGGNHSPRHSLLLGGTMREDQFLLAAAGRTKAVMVVKKVVVVVVVFCSFYCLVLPEIQTKHTRSTVGLR